MALGGGEIIITHSVLKGKLVNIPVPVLWFTLFSCSLGMGNRSEGAIQGAVINEWWQHQSQTTFRISIVPSGRDLFSS